MNVMKKLPLLNDYIDHWSEKRPDQAAMIQHEDGKTVSYEQFQNFIDYFALRLLDMGIKKGDRVATQLVLVPEHVMLMYACFKIGAIIAPLDLRLKKEEIVRDINKIAPKAFFFLGNTPVTDFREIGKAVKASCPGVDHLVQFTSDPKPGDLIEGAISITDMMKKGRLIRLKLADLFLKRLKRACAQIDTRTPALIIYTTGTTRRAETGRAVSRKHHRPEPDSGARHRPARIRKRSRLCDAHQSPPQPCRLRHRNHDDHLF